MQKYRLIGKKGEGTFSTVLKCQNVKDGSFYACKRMKHSFKSIEEVNSLREIQAMRKLSAHPNIIELVEVVYDRKSKTLALVCELMDMNVYEFIRGRKQFLPESRVKKIIFQVCRGLEFMHRKGIFHRDVKPENILISSDVVKLADFGSCRSIYSKPPFTEYISTRWYRAPECLLTDGHYTYKMDVWSVGCVFYEVLTLQPMFPGANELDQISKIHDTYGTPSERLLSKFIKSRSMSFDFPKKVGTGIEQRMRPCCASKGSIDFINQLCMYDPDERPSARQSVRSPYFSDLLEAARRAVSGADVPPTLPPTRSTVQVAHHPAVSLIPHHQSYYKPNRRRRKPKQREESVTGFSKDHMYLPSIQTNPSSSTMFPSILKPQQPKAQPRSDKLFGVLHRQLPAIHKRGQGGAL
eukprot:m.3360 g.3360  ORF g.3360 m.3360 type:complete len:410 (+) comp9303_c0_seq2:101-1330(+)